MTDVIKDGPQIVLVVDAFIPFGVNLAPRQRRAG